MKQKKTLIIAEAGVNHNNQLPIALELCDAAKEAGADVVKFQTWRTESIITHDVAQADYQAMNTGVTESQFDMLKRLEMSYEDFRVIKHHCDEIGIAFASTADEIESLDFLIGLGIPFVKVGSGDMGNVSYLRDIGRRHLPVILSTGMSALGDIERSLAALREGGAEDITLLHCTTNYPCPYEDVNLRAMQTLRAAFQLPVGYSDHTVGTEVAVAAVAMGATVIEKHFTLDRAMEGPDQAASTEPAEFRRMVDEIRHIETALGTGIKAATPAEREITRVVTKRLVAARPIRKGEILGEADIAVKRSMHGVLARDYDRLVGTVAIRDYQADEGFEIILK